MEIRNNTFNPNFQAITVPKKCQRRFMTALREECDADRLLKCVQIFEKELTNKNNVILKDVGYMCGGPCNGHLRAMVNGNDYWNSDTWNLLPAKPDTFLKKLSKKAGKGLTKIEKYERKALDYTHKAEQLKMKQLTKEGKVTEAERRNYLLGRIYELIQPKA